MHAQIEFAAIWAVGNTLEICARICVRTASKISEYPSPDVIIPNPSIPYSSIMSETLISLFVIERPFKYRLH